MTVYVAGSFTVFHDGHKKLLDRAIWECDKGERLLISIMSDEYIQKKYPGISLPTFSERMNTIKEYLRETFIPQEQVLFSCQDDPNYMPRMSWFDTLVVSEETMHRALDLIKTNEGSQYPHLSIVRMVCDKEGKEIHSKDLIGPTFHTGGRIVQLSDEEWKKHGWDEE